MTLAGPNRRLKDVGIRGMPNTYDESFHHFVVVDVSIDGDTVIVCFSERSKFLLDDQPAMLRGTLPSRHTVKALLLQGRERDVDESFIVAEGDISLGKCSVVG